MRNWLLLSASFHFMGLLAVFFFSTLSFNIPKKKDVFYIDFIGASTVVNAGPAGQDIQQKNLPAAPENEPPAAAPEPAKKTEEAEALKVPAKKEAAKPEKTAPVKTEKKTAKNNKFFSFVLSNPLIAFFLSLTYAIIANNEKRTIKQI